MPNHSGKPTSLIAFNKPFQVLSQFTDESPKQRDTLARFIDAPGYYPAGRLDYDSEGLLLLTNDGKLQARIAHPKFKQPKTYWAQVEGEIDESAIAALLGGITLNDGAARAIRAERMTEPAIWARHPPIRHRANIPTSWLSLTITEGRNRQVRRMTAHVGYPTLRLIRASIGKLSAQDIPPGTWRYVDSLIYSANGK